jgi:uncharacterized membrane protein
MASENHVENPFEYFIERLAWGARGASRAIIPHPERHAGQAVPQVRTITTADLWESLRQGAADVGALRDDILFIGVIYPVAGLLLAGLAASYDLLPMLFPLVSGFALLGPVAAIGVYEMSRRREQGGRVTWGDAFGVLRSPAIGSILGLGAVFFLLFLLWLATAGEIYIATLGPEPPQSLTAFENGLFRTSEGGMLIAAGVGAGFLFALAAFAIGVVSFPLLLDRDVGMWIAVKTSLKAVAANPGVMLVWGATVAGLLVLGSLPALVGLIFIMPLLGHASWHLYRKVVD